MSGVRSAGGSSSVAQAEQYYGTASCCCYYTDTTKRWHKSATVPRHPMAGPSCRVFFSNGCSVLSFSRSRVAVVCVSGLRERPGGLVSAHPPSLSSFIMMIGFCFYGACRQCRTVAPWDGGKKKKVTDLLPASQSLAGICSIRNRVLSNCSLIQGIERHAPLLTYISWGFVRPMTSGCKGIS
jgi:hypothetical protein